MGTDMYDGLLLVNKPKGWTSHDAVAKVRNTLKKQAGHKIKVGHTGTLDPLATGLLVLLIGSYCKKAQQFSKLDKTYEAKIKLGYNSSTGDSEGDKQAINDNKPMAGQVKSVLNSFIGDIQQMPPAYSAVKVNGKRAYKLAREGKEVKIEPRTVTIYDINEISYKYPYISFMVNVSSGTYIRSLAEDIGKKLQTGAYLASLNRTKVGKFNLEDSKDPNTINLDKIQ
ncbi:MAG TPA: tRNA pseudouridine(55) synthase TruB [Candidatus Saccharimonadales bacterium]|nr:tRNA pseudouridine(55) synthase TruB [Candidatus Saccharimonadales bacterium]